MQATQSVQTILFNVYQDFIGTSFDLDMSLIFGYSISFLGGMIQSENANIKDSSFITLRSNIFAIQNFVLFFADFLVTNVLSTADSLVSKFTISCSIAIGCIVLAPLISYFIAQRINSYEEKILMIASRISFDHSEIEKFKFSVCLELLDFDTYDWLKYSYSDIQRLRFNQFDLHHTNMSNNTATTTHQLKTHTHEVDRLETQLPSMRATLPTGLPTIMTRTSKTETNPYKRKKAMKKYKSHSQQQQQESTVSSSRNNSQSGKNYVLQSRIFVSKLSVFNRIKQLVIVMVCSVIYFIVIIIYINASRESLKKPVLVNRQANILHTNTVSFMISADLLSYGTYLQILKWPKYIQDDLTNFEKSMNASLEKVNEMQRDLTDTFYGTNPYSEEAVGKFKNLFEGNTCQYLVLYPCTNSSTKKRGITQIINMFAQIKTTYASTLTAEDTPLADLLFYLNSQDRIDAMVLGFQSSDEVIDQMGTFASDQIGTISSSIQNFMQNYLLIVGNIFSLATAVLFIHTWKMLNKNIQFMNLFLTFIPEEKLKEEATLQMLKSLRQM